ncbi:hypothetical protein NL676_011112 [Syzygium grande]|nr:hypothetical protein NL676_011112 [Syzygium grande]
MGGVGWGSAEGKREINRKTTKISDGSNYSPRIQLRLLCHSAKEDDQEGDSSRSSARRQRLRPGVRQQTKQQRVQREVQQQWQRLTSGDAVMGATVGKDGFSREKAATASYGHKSSCEGKER